MENALVALSNELAAAVERAANTIVTVNARPRMASSGVHWRQGVIVTAEHTVKHEEEITLAIPGGGSVAATLVGRDPGTDLARGCVERGANLVMGWGGDGTITARGAANADDPGQVQFGQIREPSLLDRRQLDRETHGR